MNSNTRVFLFDIEGTTTPISFVHKVLFPYSLENLDSFLEANPTPPEWNEMILSEWERESNFQSPISDQSGSIDKKGLMEYLKFLVEEDRKSPALKDLQGKIWRLGYESGKIQSEMFPDVRAFFQRIKNAGKKIAIYSSGSIEAQKLIFQYSNAGDLTSLIDSYFDTGIGNKRQKESYRKISETLKTNPNQICFFTDILEEANAASESGLEAVLMTRPGNQPQGKHNFTSLTDFSNLEL